MNRILKSETGMCASATSCYPTWQKKSYKLNWLKGKKLSLGLTNEGEIVCLPVYLATDDHKKQYIMDAVTGTLYRKDGTCCTSDHLKLISHAPKEGLEKVLLNMKNTKAMGGA